MTEQSKDRLAEFAVLALFAISLVALVVGIWASMVIGREVEGVVAIVAGAVGGIVAIVTRVKSPP